MSNLERQEKKEKTRISKLNFLIHPGFSTDPDEIQPFRNEQEINKEAWSHIFLLERYLEKARNMDQDELMIAFLHAKGEDLKLDAKQNKLYLKAVKELKKILGKRLVVVSDKINVIHDANALEKTKKILNARGYYFDQDVIREAFGECGGALQAGRNNLDKSGKFLSQTPIDRELTDAALINRRTLQTAKFEPADLESNKSRYRYPNLVTSERLLEKSPQEGEPGDDEVFVIGKILRQTNRGWRIEIVPGSPSVVKYESTKKKLDLPHSPTVQEMRSGDIFPGFHLISGGSFVWAKIEGKQRLILFRRKPLPNEPAADIGLLTGPAGRCGESLSRTCRKETNEELIVLSQNKTVGFFREGDDPEEIIVQKIEQAEHKLKKAEDMQEKWSKLPRNRSIRETMEKNSRLINILRKIKSVDDVKMLDTKVIHAGDKNLDRISMSVAGHEIDLVENCIGVLDPRTNTFEAREVLSLPDNLDIQFAVDGELDREVVLAKSLLEINQSEIVPALSYYRNRLLFNNN